jgi:hypothetical protein
MFALAAVSALCGWGLTFLLERWLDPRPRLVGRPAAAHALHLGTWLAVFGAFLLLVRRPALAAALGFLVWLLFVSVSNAKRRSLREPMVFTDLPFVTNAFRHPRLYLPFLGTPRVALFTAALTVVGIGGWYLLRFWPPPARWPGHAPVAAAVWLPAAALVWAGGRWAAPPTLDPVADLQRWGLAASLWLYRNAEHRRELSRPPSPFGPAASAPPGVLPDIVVVQSESFFDARRVFSNVRADLLPHFDHARRDSVAEGRLSVPAWGANTVRTEFSFLSGLANEDLGIDRLNPYRALALLPVPTIASYLRGLGYRTICVHPHPAAFYTRDRVFPAFGFERFVDLSSFEGAERFGPYVSDTAVADAVARIVGESDRPAFVFAITMENHGPLHLETVAAGEPADYFRVPPADASPAAHDLTVYLRHLRNADRMLERLKAWMAARARPGVLCFYGDHVPIMPEVWETTDACDGTTDYVIWRTGHADAGSQVDVPVDRLGVMLVEAAGLASPRAITEARELAEN